MDQDLYNEQSLRRFNDWRKRKAKKLPEIAKRVFALRTKMYMGCGFHWHLEKDLGIIIRDLNDFDNSYRDFVDRAIVKVVYNSLLEQLDKAEKSAEKMKGEFK